MAGISAWLAGRLLTALGPWLLGGVVALVLAGAGAYGTQTWRLKTERAAHRETAHELAVLRLQHTVGALEFELLAAEAGRNAVEDYRHEVSEQAPVVERVVERVRNICVRDEARDPGSRGLPLPAAAAGTAGPGLRNGDAEDRAFSAAVGRDLAACADELVRFRKVMEHYERLGADDVR